MSGKLSLQVRSHKMTEPRYREVQRIQTPDSLHGIIQRVPDGRMFMWEAPNDGDDPLLIVHTLIKQLEDAIDGHQDDIPK